MIHQKEKVFDSDGVSRLGLCLAIRSDAHFGESRSRRQPFSRLWISQGNCLGKFLQFNNFLFVVFVGRKKTKKVRKMPEIWTKFNLQVMTTFFMLAKSINSKFSLSECLMKVPSRSRSFNHGLVIEGYGPDYITGFWRNDMRVWKRSTSVFYFKSFPCMLFSGRFTVHTKPVCYNCKHE